MNCKKPEPYKIKAVEEITLLNPSMRKKAMEKAGLNPFALPSQDVYIDLLTDSGTGAMSDWQWAALMHGDESYAGSKSYYRLKEQVDQLFDLPFFLPAHQGRGAENIVFPLLIKPGQYVLGNMHFDTTKAHIDLAGGIGVNLIGEEAFQTELELPFKGNIDLNKVQSFIKAKGSENIAAIIMTITCNSAGGQPVSLENMKKVREIALKEKIPLFIDGARFAENAYFIKQREQGQSAKTITEITQEFFALADGYTLSAKKDGLVNIGGLMGFKSEELYLKAQQRLVPYEGFVTYGGMTGRDMEALARGLVEVVDERYLSHRLGQVEFLATSLDDLGIPVQKPAGGHAVFVDGKKFLAHIPQEHFPSHALCIELYLTAGVRAVEIGALLAGRDPQTNQNILPSLDLMRLTIPRRTYTQNHLAYVAEALGEIKERKHKIKGVKMTYEPPILRHFTAKFAPIS